MKMDTILFDIRKFRKVRSVKEQQERALQAFLLRAQKARQITKVVCHKIRPVGFTRPRMYGVPKLHKEGPILSMVNAPQHAMAKWFTDM